MLRSDDTGAEECWEGGSNAAVDMDKCSVMLYDGCM